MKARIEDIAYALPENVVTNAMLRESYPEWDFDRLEDRTGVFERHIAGPGETALDLTEKACAKLDLNGVDGIVFCTETPDHPIPSNACLLHGRLGLAKNVLALDINMGCSGYVYALEVARSLVRCGTATKILLATGDTYSQFINSGDRATRVLFGDGAAVSIISGSQDDSGIIDLTLGSSGKHYERFMVPAGGSRQPLSDATTTEVTDKSGNVRTPADITMDGFGVLSFFNGTIPGEVQALLERNQLGIDDPDLFVFHQASRVALDSIARALKIPDEKMVRNMGKVGNLVSSSVPVALKMAMDSGKAQPGDLVLLCGFGVGLSWATALMKV
jgi:3-oxoacyl-[acyl-carrier-protein] synthase III